VIWIVLGGCALLMLIRLGDQTLRLDEARTGLLGVSVLRRGVPSAWVDKNPSCLSRAEVDGRGLSILHTWLTYYLVAAGMRLCGRGSLGCRILPALAALGGAAVAYAAGRDRWGEEAGLFAALLLAGNVSYLLLGRQARYYGPSFLCQGLCVWAALRLAAEPGLSAGVWLGLAGILLFHFDWPTFVATAVGLGVCLPLIAPASLAPLAPALALQGAAIVPWLAFVRRGGTPLLGEGLRPRPDLNRLLDTYVHVFWVYVWKLCAYFVPLHTLILVRWAAPLYGHRPGPLPPDAWLPALVVVCVLGSRSCTEFVFSRYIVGTFIPAALLGGLLLADLHQAAPQLAWALTGVILATNWAHVWPYWIVRLLPGTARLVPFLKSPQRLFNLGVSLHLFARRRCAPHSPLLRYLGELRRGYHTRVAALCTYLKQHARPGAVVLTDGMEAPPLAFHGGLRVLSFRDAAGRLPDPLDPVTGLGPADVDWVIPGGFTWPQGHPGLERLLSDFEPVFLADVPDVYLDNTETLDRHHFMPPDNIRGLVIHRRRRPALRE